MLEVKGLSKSFIKKNQSLWSKKSSIKPFYAVNHIDFNCQPGEVIGLLGANGAGKTTTLRMIATTLQPDSGEIWFNGINTQKNPQQFRQQLGFLSATTNLYQRLTVKENLHYFGELQGLNKAYRIERIQTLAQELEFEHFINQAVSELSQGMLQKANLARCLLNKPKLLILDEPTTGLDIVNKEKVLEIILALKQQGLCIIFSTHHLDEVTRVCDRLVLMRKQKQVISGSLDDIMQHYATDNLQTAILTLLLD